MMASLDGYFEGAGHDISWHNVDAEFNTFANEQLDEADTLVFGRKTYELMASFWPTQKAIAIAPDTASRMNSLSKIVFSGQPLMPNWESTTAHTNIQILNGIKQQSGKAIAVLGSSNLCISLLRAGLLDEVRVMVNPVVLGKGSSLFEGIDKSTNFRLANTRIFKSGNVLLRYDTKVQKIPDR